MALSLELTDTFFIWAFSVQLSYTLLSFSLSFSPYPFLLSLSFFPSLIMAFQPCMEWNPNKNGFLIGLAVFSYLPKSRNEPASGVNFMYDFSRKKNPSVLFYQLAKFQYQALFASWDNQEYMLLNFHLRHNMILWTLRFIFNQLFLQWLTGAKGEENINI